jgi:hypothetical protein
MEISDIKYARSRRLRAGRAALQAIDGGWRLYELANR